MTRFPQKLQNKLLKREERATYRSLPDPTGPVDFSSNDYLGLARSKDIHESALHILKENNIGYNGATGSRLLTGNNNLYTKLEAVLSQFHDTESALVFNSGYDANVGFFSAVPQRGDIVFYDELVHASIRDGIAMGNAKSYKFAHNDLANLKDKISKSNHGYSNSGTPEIYVVTEAVFSMDGDAPDLKSLANFCSINNYHLVVDEAHATGVFGAKGEGLVQECGLQDHVFARITTFGKSVGCHGAAVLGSADLKNYLINFARSFIYTTGLPPHTLATVLAAYEHLGQTNRPTQELRDRIELFKRYMAHFAIDLKFISSNSAIQCCMIPGNEAIKSISQTLSGKGFDVRPILSPTVPLGAERLRFCIHTFNTEEEIKGVLELLKGEIYDL